MDYNKLLDFCVDLGYELSMAGAETFRVEESITRIMAAYQLQAEVFAIPNSLIVSFIQPTGQPYTRMRRIGFHGNDLDSVERFSNLSRRICREVPDVDTAYQWLEETRNTRRSYPLPIILLGYFMASGAYGFFFGGSPLDAFIAGLGGIAVGLVNHFTALLKTNPFFSTILASIPLAIIPYALNAFGLSPNPDASIIGTVMVLIPGLLFTTAMRDIIYGDTNSGVNRIFQVMLIAVAIACGTAVALTLTRSLWGEPQSVADLDHSFLAECLVPVIGGIGFSLLFNIHGKGMLLGCLGGIITWTVYCLTVEFGADPIFAHFYGSAAAAIYSEVMARIRKFPTTGYLIISLLILIPGSSLYYTIYNLLRGNMAGFVEKGTATVFVAGLMAVGILMVSTSVRMWTEWERRKKK